MAIIFTLLSMLMACGEDLLEKKVITSKTEEVLKTLVWYGIFNIILVCVVVAFGLEDTSLLPHELIAEKPVVILPAAFSCAVLLFSLTAYKYVGVSVKNSFANVDGLFYIVLLMIFYLVTGKASFAIRLFTPSAIIGVVLVVTAAIVYPNLKVSRAEAEEELNTDNKGKRALILGIVFALLAAFCDGSESLTSSYLIGDDVVDSMDYIGALALVQAGIGFLIWIVLSIHSKKIYNPFRKNERIRCLSQMLSLAADVLYVFALSDDALIGVILWNAFPILDILAARIFFKEKLTRNQYIVLFMLLAGAVLVSLA